MKPSHGQQQNNQLLKNEWLLTGGKEHFRRGEQCGQGLTDAKAYGYLGIETISGEYLYTSTQGNKEVRSMKKRQGI